MSSMRWGSLTVAAVRIDGVLAPGDASTLHPVELARAAVLPAGPERDRFVNGRVALRRFAAGLLDARPQDLALDYACANCGLSGAIDHGRPGYRAGGAEARLSLSRSGPWALLVGTADASVGAVGVDLEDVAGAGFAGFDHVALTPTERSLLTGGTDPAQARRMRARLWSRKEAFLKATGAGLFREPSTVEVSGESLEGIELADLDPAALGLPAGLVAAVALRHSR